MISDSLLWFICLLAYQHLMGYLKLKFYTYDSYAVIGFNIPL